jgi:hypothetical protein
MRCFLCWMLVMSMLCSASELSAPFTPPAGKRLLILGQDLGSIGGFPAPNNQGYADHLSLVPGGVTTYTDLLTLRGLQTMSNVGSGDTWAQAIIERPVYSNSVLVIGLYLVDREQWAAEGKLDFQINVLAEWIRNCGRPVFLRIGYEFDGSWNHYDPKFYQATWRRMVDHFRAAKVTNCATVWQAATSPVNGTQQDLARWYPGDEYVDWIGSSWFLSNEKQVELTDGLLDFARAHNKPVMICESAPQGYDTARLTRRNIGFEGAAGADSRRLTAKELWDEWYVPFFAYLDRHRDIIRMVAYINANWDSQPLWGPPYRQGYWGDSRIEVNAELTEKWLERFQQAEWLSASPTLFRELGFRRK